MKLRELVKEMRDIADKHFQMADSFGNVNPDKAYVATMQGKAYAECANMLEKRLAGSPGNGKR